MPLPAFAVVGAVEEDAFDGRVEDPCTLVEIYEGWLEDMAIGQDEQTMTDKVPVGKAHVVHTGVVETVDALENNEVLLGF